MKTEAAGVFGGFLRWVVGFKESTPQFCLKNFDPWRLDVGQTAARRVRWTKIQKQMRTEASGRENEKKKTKANGERENSVDGDIDDER